MLPLTKGAGTPESTGIAHFEWHRSLFPIHSVLAEKSFSKNEMLTFLPWKLHVHVNKAMVALGFVNQA